MFLSELLQISWALTQFLNSHQWSYFICSWTAFLFALLSFAQPAIHLWELLYGLVLNELRSSSHRWTTHETTAVQSALTPCFLHSCGTPFFSPYLTFSVSFLTCNFRARQYNFLICNSVRPFSSFFSESLLISLSLHTPHILRFQFQFVYMCLRSVLLKVNGDKI